MKQSFLKDDDVKFDRLIGRTLKRFLYHLIGFVGILAVGTMGYRMIGGHDTTLIDAFYMTYITIATIGYGEIIDLSHSPSGRIFTMFIAVVGIFNFTFFMSSLTAFLVEIDISSIFRHRRMQKMIDQITGHYIICGIGRIGATVANELATTGRPYVCLDINHKLLEQHSIKYPDALVMQGDATDDVILQKAGVTRAAGIFAITGDDSRNLVITLSARQLNSDARIIACCHDSSFVDKIKKVGADDIISLDFIGGMRIVSSMIRPRVVSFLDEMLRADKTLRVEEVCIPCSFTSMPMASLKLSSPNFVLLAVCENNQWHFNPGRDFVLKPGCSLIVMTTLDGRHQLEQMLKT